METGYVIEEGGVLTRVAEAAIVFGDGCEYAPVIQGTSVSQVLQATDSAVTVLGFVKKPLYGTIVAGDTVDVVTRGIIRMRAAAGVVMNDPVEVHSVVTEVAQLVVVSPVTTLEPKVGRALTAVSANMIWLEIGIGY